MTNPEKKPASKAKINLLPEPEIPRIKLQSKDELKKVAKLMRLGKKADRDQFVENIQKLAVTRREQNQAYRAAVKAVNRVIALSNVQRGLARHNLLALLHDFVSVVHKSVKKSPESFQGFYQTQGFVPLLFADDSDLIDESKQLCDQLDLGRKCPASLHKKSRLPKDDYFEYAYLLIEKTVEIVFELLRGRRAMELSVEFQGVSMTIGELLERAESRPLESRIEWRMAYVLAREDFYSRGSKHPLWNLVCQSKRATPGKRWNAISKRIESRFQELRRDWRAY